MAGVKSIFKVIYYNSGELYEIYAHQVSQDGLYGFIEVEDLIFGERTQVVVDPSEERLKSEFEGVRRFYIPIHAVVRIDEVEKEGHAKIKELTGKEGNVMTFPTAMYKPGGDKA